MSTEHSRITFIILFGIICEGRKELLFVPLQKAEERSLYDYTGLFCIA